MIFHAEDMAMRALHLYFASHQISAGAAMRASAESALLRAAPCG
jgi:hypothetical protein